MHAIVYATQDHGRVVLSIALAFSEAESILAYTVYKINILMKIKNLVDNHLSRLKGNREQIVKYKKVSPFSIPTRAIFSAGPSSAGANVLGAVSQPVVGYLDPWFLEMLEETSDLLRELWQTKQRAFAVSGSGSAGMEAGLSSLAEPGDKVVICSYGRFCERQVIMAKRLGLEVEVVESEWGRSMPPELLSTTLDRNSNVRLVTAVHAETSTGVIQDLKPLSKLSCKHGAFFMADCVASLAGSPVRFDEWGLDYAYSGTQKCLGCPPGLAPAALSDRAYKYIKTRKTSPVSWYLDLGLIADYWSPEHTPHHTNPVNLCYGLRTAAAQALAEGLEMRFDRHVRNASALRAGLKALGLDLLDTPMEERLNQITVVVLPPGVDGDALRLQLFEEYGVEISPGLGKLKGKAMRIGLMGESCTADKVLELLSVLEEILPSYGVETIRGEAAAAAAADLASYFKTSAETARNSLAAGQTDVAKTRVY